MLDAFNGTSTNGPKVPLGCFNRSFATDMIVPTTWSLSGMKKPLILFTEGPASPVNSTDAGCLSVAGTIFPETFRTNPGASAKVSSPVTSPTSLVIASSTPGGDQGIASSGLPWTWPSFTTIGSWRKLR